MNYGNEVRNTVAAHVESMEALDNQAREIEEKLKQERITGRVAAEKRQELEGTRAAAIAAAQEKIRRLHQAHDQAVDQWNSLSAEKLHEDYKLLELNIPMDRAQYQQLCDRHRDNSLMLSLLAQYADRHQDQPLFADRPADAKTRKEAFADFAERGIGVCRNYNSLSCAMFLDGLSFPESVMYEY